MDPDDHGELDVGFVFPAADPDDDVLFGFEDFPAEEPDEMILDSPDDFLDG